MVRTEPRGGKLPYSDLALAELRTADAPAAAPPGRRRAAPAQQAAGAQAPAPVASVSPRPEARATAPASQFEWPARGKVVQGFAEPRSMGIWIDGKLGDPVVAAAEGQGDLQRARTARLRQSSDRQARRRHPVGLRAQPRAAGEGRRRRSRADSGSPSWASRAPTARSCTSRSARRASRSIRRSCCPRADGAGPGLRHRDGARRRRASSRLVAAGGRCRRREVAELAFERRREKTGSDFLPLHMHRVVAIGCLFRDADGLRVRCLGKRR